MSASLDEAKSKVQWGEKHFSDFKDILLGRTSGIDARKTTVLHYDLQKQSNPVPPSPFAPARECRLAFGDAIHQLRSSLDHITYAMVKPLTTDHDVLRKVDFPIFIKGELFEKHSRSVTYLRNLLRPDQFAAILGTQPYKRNSTAPETDPLWILSELDNIDKNRTILVVDPRLMTKRRLVDGTTQVIKQPLVPGAQGLGLPKHVPRAPSEVEVEERTLTVVLSETGLSWDNRIVFGVWRELVANVKAVITDFEAGGLV
jgi:hypothetical protein